MSRLNAKEAGRLGAIRRNELYGNPGTPAGRRRGGIVSCSRFKRNPKLAERLGFKLRKHIFRPKRSALLAEFVGIVLGDGTMNEHQVRIYSSSKTDVNYAYFIKKIIEDLFKITSTIALRRKNTLETAITSKNLVGFLVAHGLKKLFKGNS